MINWSFETLSILMYLQKLKQQPFNRMSSFVDGISWWIIRTVQCHASSKNLKLIFWRYLSHNQLSGSIPTLFGRLLRLSDLYWPWLQLENASEILNRCLDNNEFTGEIPKEFGRCFGLKRLYRISCRIVSYYIVNLMYRSFADNQLEGDIPTELFRLKNISEL